MTQDLHPIVINADDGALDQEVDECLLRLADEGMVRSVSVMATTALTESFVKSASECGLGIGLHVNLVEGQALGGPYRTLTNPRGEFLGPKARVWALARAGAIDPGEVEQEVRLQWERVVATGVRPRHLDGHNHVHVLPGIFPGIRAALSSETGLYFRVPDEPECEHPECGGPVGEARKLLAQPDWCPPGWRRVERFVGLRFMQTPALTELAHLETRKAKTTEWMVHPGAAEVNEFRRDPRRSLETRVLASSETREALRRWGYAPRRFEDLP